MPIWFQTLLVLLVVAGALALVIYQATRTLAGKRSRLGSCCAKGCPTTTPTKPENVAPAPQRIVFLPIEFVGKPKK